MTKSTSGLHWLWLSALVIGLDQFSKYLAETHLAFQTPQALLPGLNLTLMYNTGAAFSFLSTAGGWQRWLFTGLAIVASIALVVWLKRLPAAQRAIAIALAAILGGALGNVIDRIRLGHVIDFIDVYYRGWHWPAFNIADSAITLGVAVLIVDAVLTGKRAGPHN